MSTFITKADYITNKRVDEINQIIDDDDSVLDEAEEEAISEVRDYLFQRYDVDTIFSQVEAARSKSVVRWVKHLVMRNIYSLTSEDNVPDDVIVNAERTIEILEQIAGGERTAELPRLQDENAEPKTIFRWGSVTKRRD